MKRSFHQSHLVALFLILSLPACGSSSSGKTSQPATKDAGVAATVDDGGGWEPSHDDAGKVHPSDAGTKPATDAGMDASQHEMTDAGMQGDPDAHVDPPAHDASVPQSDDDSGVTTDSGITEGRTDGCPTDAPLALDRVRITPAAGQAAMLVGARIQGSNSGPTTDFVDLKTVSAAPAASGATELTFGNTTIYRYIRYYAANGSQGGLAEIEFYHGATRLSGNGFGTTSTSGQNGYSNALDGNPSTYFDPTTDGGGYVGLDIARGYVTSVVSFSPAGLNSDTPVDVTLTAAGTGVTIRYTSDGSTPTATNGSVYTSAVHVGSGRTILTAYASSACHFDSPVMTAGFTIGGSTPVLQGLTSYHIGNSLTDTINPWLAPIANSTGVQHRYARWTIPGAPIGWLAGHQGQGFQDPDGANQFDTFVQTFAPIDHMSVQPYSDPDLTTQGTAAVQMFNQALMYNPNIQFWIYAQWPGQTEWTTDGFSNGGGNVYPAWQVPSKPTTWEEATRNHALYHEFFRNYVDENVAGKKVLIVPGGLALVELKRQIDMGLVPGYTDFFGSIFADEEHLTVPGQDLISLVFYSCLYRQTPENRVTYAGTNLTAQQAQILQSIAWNVASSYPLSGISQ